MGQANLALYLQKLHYVGPGGASVSGKSSV